MVTENRFGVTLRALIFAVLMSSVTSILVTGFVLLINHADNASFIYKWVKAVILAWPIIFISILFVAPQINRLVDFILCKKANQ